MITWGLPSNLAYMNSARNQAVLLVMQIILRIHQQKSAKCILLNSMATAKQTNSPLFY